ncbi:MAG: ribbon-helix-helix domain-containing protein [Planctomycetota bacterium]|jgi:antitoxin ParD1/3/4
MAEGVNVRITGKLRRFIEEQAGPNGLYESASEYVRDLIRRDYQRQEERKWSWLMDQLRPGMEAGNHKGRQKREGRQCILRFIRLPAAELSRCGIIQIISFLLVRITKIGQNK